VNLALKKTHIYDLSRHRPKKEDRRKNATLVARGPGPKPSHAQGTEKEQEWGG